MGNNDPEEEKKSHLRNEDQIYLAIPINENDTHLPIRSWTRLGLGIILLGLDALMDRTQVWEQKVEESQTTNYPQSQEQKTSSLPQHAKALTPSSMIESHQPRQALVGLIFDIQNRVFRGVTTVHRLESLANRLISPVVTPLVNGRLFRPVKNRFDKLVSRGQERIDYWVQIGLAEESHSRQLLKTATITTVDTSIDYLSTNPDVKELVQSQSTNLINEIIEEVRERTVSGDTLVEGIVRAALHLTPRHNLPEPPIEVRMRAVRIRPPKIEKFMEDR